MGLTDIELIIAQGEGLNADKITPDPGSLFRSTVHLLYRYNFAANSLTAQKLYKLSAPRTGLKNGPMAPRPWTGRAPPMDMVATCNPFLDCPVSTKKTPQHGVREVLYGVMSEGCLFDFPTVRVSSCKFWNDSSILIITLKKTVSLTVLVGSFEP